MALKIDITDEKGVKTRYHKIKTFTFNGTNLTVQLSSYVNQAVRDAEKQAVDNNKLAEQYDNDTNDLRAELDRLSAQIQSTDDPDPAVVDRAKELSDTLASRATAQDRPVYATVTDRHYSEITVEVDYFEPLTIDGIYAKLATEGRYAGAESI